MENPPDKLPEKSKNGKIAFSPEIEQKILEACGNGFTIEKAGALVGVNPSTIRTWIQRKPSFGQKVETARKSYEMSLLKSVYDAGEKSWQARAWILERTCGYAAPSSRLSVDTSVTHGVNGSFAALLAGLASRRAEKKAQVIEAKEVKQLENTDVNTLSNQSKYTNCCATNADDQQVASQKNGLGRKRRIKTRKPRQESLKKWPVHDTPPATPPATDSHA
ncbi:helix-turn-helix domain-containing protein [bacterium]|nr:helix-turn-helix domain-containing protein [bacterium]